MHLRAETLTPAAMSMDLSIVIVHYRTPRLAVEAVSAIRRDLDAGGLRAECLMVDNGSDAAGADALDKSGVTVLTPGGNLGYAGGVNLGAACSSAPLIVAMNADVIVRPGCLAALCRELWNGAAAAGPCFSWDLEGRVLLPPTEQRDLMSDALARLGARDRRWARVARARWRRHARRHWLAGHSVRSYALSGALLAVRRDAWNAVGPFDETFRLYFEETDWLARLARRGWQARYIASARAVHRYNSSAQHEPAAAAWFEDSSRHFDEKHRRRAHDWLRRIERWPRIRHTAPAGPAPAADPTFAERGSAKAPSVELTASARWIEVSAAAAGYPAAAERLERRAPHAAGRRWRLPCDVWDHLAAGRYLLRVIDRFGRERHSTTFLR